MSGQTGYRSPGVCDRMPQWKKDRARQMRRRPTATEALMWTRLRRKALGGRFLRQRPMYGYIADFYCAASHLIVEVDGAYHADRATVDAHRDYVFASHGIRTLRLPGELVESDLDEAVALVLEAL